MDGRSHQTRISDDNDGWYVRTYDNTVLRVFAVFCYPMARIGLSLIG